MPLTIIIYRRRKIDEKIKRDAIYITINIFNKVIPNDFIWTRYNGEYYIARVEDSMWFFNNKDEVTKLDNIKWKK